MAPHNIDDLPRREEREDTRPLMLGLIDDLPDERGGARQLMMWGLVGLAVALFVVLVWVTAPNGPPGTTSLFGESQVSKNNNVMPRQNSAVASGQNASGETARIEQTATPLQLSDAQRQQIRQYFASKPGQRTEGANFSLAVGAAVPQDVPLQKLPPEILSALGGYQGNDYVLVGDQLVIVDPTARRVVALVPQIS
jgi:Protein of unknown function (DUF1236)